MSEELLRLFEILRPSLEAILVGLLSYAAIILRRWLAEKMQTEAYQKHSEKVRLTKELVFTVVAYLGQSPAFSQVDKEDLFAYAMGILPDYLSEFGIEVTEDEIRRFIEEAVALYKQVKTASLEISEATSNLE